MSHSNISVFVPHIGCEHQCSFCNQRHITGQAYKPMADDVHSAVRTSLKSPKHDSNNCEIAFFGGSFTAIERNYMLELLEAAYSYVLNGEVRGIRISTRPDCIDNDILSLLKNYGVTAIELGAQSMIDSVLIANERGHSQKDVVFASKLIKDFGFELGLQMMTGLYKSTHDFDIKTAEALIDLSPDTVRIYPTITLNNTRIAELYRRNEYLPPTLDESVKLCCRLVEMFECKGIKVIRLGLHTIESDAFVAGPWHPAFSELCASYRFRNKIDALKLKPARYEIYVNKSDVSKFIGQKRCNIDYFLSKGLCFTVVSDNNTLKNDFLIKEVK